MPVERLDGELRTLRQRVVENKQARNNAMVANATAEDAGKDLRTARRTSSSYAQRVHMAPREAREAGCDVSDLLAGMSGTSAHEKWRSVVSSKPQFRGGFCTKPAVRRR